MSSTPSNFEEPPRSHERRRSMRQRVRSLAYLDVVPNNGGIVLNLSENGLALQAVNPFDEARVSLRIQPPSSRRRIEANAEVAWLSESKREVGLQFLGLTEEARLEIADWVAAESGVSEPKQIDESPNLPAHHIPPKAIIAEPTRLRAKWAAMLAESQSETPSANQETPDPAASLAARNQLKPQPDPTPGKNPTIVPSINPALNVAAIHSTAATETDAPVRVPMSSTRVSRVVEFPVPEHHAAGELFRELSSSSPASVPVKAAEAPGVVAPVMYSELLELLAHRLRKPLGIAALFACAAVISLLAGMAITRQSPKADPAKSGVQEGARPPGLPSAPALTRDGLAARTASRSGASHPKTQHTPQQQSRGGKADSPLTKLASPIEPAPVRLTSPSEYASVATAPPLPAPGLASVAPEINPPPPATLQRRSDCYLLYRVEPLYPREAKARGVEGTVTIHLQIGSDGRVQNLRELSGPSLLVPAALEAAREWRFIPALVNGQPVEAEKDVSIVFHLPH